MIIRGAELSPVAWHRSSVHYPKSGFCRAPLWLSVPPPPPPLPAHCLLLWCYDVLPQGETVSGGGKKGAENREGQRAKRGRGRRDVGLGAHLQLAMRSGVIADPQWLRVARNRTHAPHINTVCSQWFSCCRFSAASEVRFNTSSSSFGAKLSSNICLSKANASCQI